MQFIIYKLLQIQWKYNKNTCVYNVATITVVKLRQLDITVTLEICSSQQLSLDLYLYCICVVSVLHFYRICWFVDLLIVLLSNWAWVCIRVVFGLYLCCICIVFANAHKIVTLMICSSHRLSLDKDFWWTRKAECRMTEIFKQQLIFQKSGGKYMP